MKVAGVIPARFGSTRFPGKPLALICGKPLLQWVIEGCQKSSQLSELLVATDDERIALLSRSLGVQPVMTDSDLASGTDRVFAAIQGGSWDAILNIQGDEVLMGPEFIDPMVESFKTQPNLDMVTLAHTLTTAELENLNVVKVLINQKSEATYFSRFPIPHSRQSPYENTPLAYKHIGLYGYHPNFLARFCREPQSSWEQAESLEQLRALQMGARIQVKVVDKKSLGVDTPEDLRRAEEILNWV